MSSTTHLTGVRLPASRGRQGDRDMFLLCVPNAMLLRNFSAEAEPIETPDHRAQRQLDQRHVDDIVTYITENPEDYVLGAVTYAIDTIDAEKHFEEHEPGTGVGTLVLPLDAELRCLDGQHRRAAIAQAVAIDDRVKLDYTAVVLYVEDDYVKRRQMFSDMNATPKVVAKALNVSFDSRDPFARAALKLAKEHPLFVGVVELEKARVSTRSPQFFSLAGVYDGLKRYVLGPTLPRGRSPRDKSAEELYEIGDRLYGVLADARDEFRVVAEGAKDVAEDEKALAALMATERRKTLLLSTTTLRVVAGALHVAMKRDKETDPAAYRESLARADFSSKSRLFNDVGFVGRNGTPSARNQEVLDATKALAAVLRPA